MPRDRLHPGPLACLLAVLSALLSSTAPAESIARTWNEENLAAVRLSFPDPPVHARNLFHVSVAMYDAWAAYDDTAVGYLHREAASAPDGRTVDEARHEAISYAAYRVLSYRYSDRAHPNTPEENTLTSQANFDARMALLGYAIENTSTSGDDPAAVGNRVAATILAVTAGDQSREDTGYDDPTYTPANEPLILEFPGTSLNDYNRWQPLQFVKQFSQTGRVLFQASAEPLVGKVHER